MGLLTIERGMTTKKMGRPAGPEKVVFKRRVLPGLVSMLDSVIEAGYKAETHEVVVIEDCKWAESLALKDKELDGLKKQNMALANDIAKLEKEKLDLEGDVRHWQEADLDEKGRTGWRKYYAAIKSKDAYVQSDA